MIDTIFAKVVARVKRTLVKGTHSPEHSCPVCKAQRCVLFDASREQSMLICAQCRHLFWAKFPTEAELASFYQTKYCESHQQPDIQAKNRAYYREHVEELAGIIGRPKDRICLVDYGSSIPTLVQEAKALGVCRPIAVDHDATTHAFAHEHGLESMTPKEYVERLEDESVDVIRFSHVLEHLVDPVATVCVGVRKLRPGGLLYITQPNFPVFQAIRSNRHIKDSLYPTHLHFFSPLSVLQLLSHVPVRILKLFSLGNAEEAYADLRCHVDLPYARATLASVKEIGESVRGEYANYPFFAGENSCVHAIKRAA